MPGSGWIFDAPNQGTPASGWIFTIPPTPLGAGFLILMLLKKKH